ncbi:hypothetical protein FWD20_00140 [Candidatus Saccharibacteria bacterium]|nr:hypothetical protein [Candidatus Saccharibacteria bacterium]
MKNFIESIGNVTRKPVAVATVAAAAFGLVGGCTVSGSNRGGDVSPQVAASQDDMPEDIMGAKTFAAPQGERPKDIEPAEPTLGASNTPEATNKREGITPSPSKQQPTGTPNEEAPTSAPATIEAKDEAEPPAVESPKPTEQIEALDDVGIIETIAEELKLYLGAGSYLTDNKLDLRDRSLRNKLKKELSALEQRFGSELAEEVLKSALARALTGIEDPSPAAKNRDYAMRFIKGRIGNLTNRTLNGDESAERELVKIEAEVQEKLQAAIDDGNKGGNPGSSTENVSYRRTKLSGETRALLRFLYGDDARVDIVEV